MSDLAVTCRITIPSGWLSVNTGVYRLGKDSFVSEGTSWRRQDAVNPFVEGSWTVAAVRDNVMETMSVYVRGTTMVPVYSAVQALKDAISQRNYAIELTVNKVQRVYTCSMGDFQVQASTELRVAKMAQVIAQIPRHPVFTETVV